MKMVHPYEPLSQTLTVHPRDLRVCQACGLGGDVARAWREHDAYDTPQPRFVMLCDSCAKRLIPKHPVLYGRLPANEPMVGVMECCRDCIHRQGLECVNPLRKSRGGPGLPIHYLQPQVMLVHGFRGGRRAGWQDVHYPSPPTCDGHEAIPLPAPRWKQR
jgi:hypothetical protein